MDRKTRQKLLEISSKVSKDRMDDLVKEEDVYAEEREKMKRILDKHGYKMPKKVKEQIKGAVEGKAMNRKRETINEKVANEIEEDIDKEVRWAMKKGRIDPADPEKDKFLKKMLDEKK